MYIKEIEFQDFRNIESEKIEFKNGINVIFGENAQGKTNILEGIYLFARGKSFRALNEKELIRFNKSIAYTKITFSKKTDECRLGVEISKSKPKKFYRNNVRVERTSEIIGEFRSVLFCPSHLGIIKDAPSVRRRFLDVAISQLRPIYIKMMSRYNTVLESRNTILKMEKEEREKYKEMLNIYSEELASLCADIAGIRVEYINKLDYWVKIFIDEMTEGKETPKLTYETNAKENDFDGRESLKNKYLSLLKNNLEREYKYGATLFGIHKDDLKIELNGKDSRLYSSQGQQRSLSLALKMAEGEISREHSGEYPVFLFDDVLSEIDDKRKKYILSNMDRGQVIITACDSTAFSEIDDVNFIYVNEGKLIDFSVKEDESINELEPYKSDEKSEE